MAIKLLTHQNSIMLISNQHDATVKEHYISRLAELLDDSGVTKMNSSTDSFSFKAPPFRWVWNGFNLFNLVTSANFSFEESNEVLYFKYKFQFIELFIIALCLSLSLVPSWILGNYKWLGILAVSIWTLIFFGGRIFCAIRFKLWVEKELEKLEYQMTEEAGDLPPYDISQN